jgi:RimK-like ATPgrasp N-terminal domain
MTALLVVDHPEQWPLTFPAAEVISADAYLRDERFSELRQARVYNLCDSYAYQTAGYYVSLLAAARGHRTMPGVATIQDMKSRSLLRADDELEELIQRSLHKIVSKRFELSIYFGCNLAERHADLSRALFNLIPVPLMKASFSKSSTTGKWRPSSITPIPVGDLPTNHGAFLRDREPLCAPRPCGPLRPQHSLRARSRDPDERRRALAAVEPRSVEALRARRAVAWVRRGVFEPRRLRTDRRVRRAVHS